MKSMYVERQAHLCEAAKENFERLGLKNAIVKNGDGIEVLHSFHSKKNAASDFLGITEEQSQSLLKTNLGLKLIFIDPARRDDAGNKVVSLEGLHARCYRFAGRNAFRRLITSSSNSLRCSTGTVQ